MKTIPQPRAAPVPAPRLAAHKTLTAKKPADPKLVPAPRNPVPTPKKETEALKKTPGPAPAAGPGLGKTPPSLGASTRVPPASGSGNADANITSNTLAVDFDPPLPPMAPMAPAPAAWAGPPPAAPVAVAPGPSPGESPTASAPAEARDAFDPLGAWLPRLGAGAGFVAPAPRAGRARAGAGEPTRFARARAGHPRSGAGGSGPQPAPPGRPPTPPGAPPPPRPARRRRSRAARPPRRRASPGGGTRRPPVGAPPAPPDAAPGARAERVRRRHLRRFLLGVVSRLSFGGRRRDPFGAFRRSASEPHHERFDSDEFRAEGRELEDELMALTGGLMHLDDDDDEISPRDPKPEEEARGSKSTTTTDPRRSDAIRTRANARRSEDDGGPRTTTTTDGSVVKADETAGVKSAQSAQSAESPAPRVSETMTRSVSKIRVAASEGRAVPTEFFCSITHDVMVDPVIAWDGYTYERVSVARWLAKHSTSPMTGAPMPDFTLRPNHSMRSQMMGFGRSCESVAARGVTGYHRTTGVFFSETEARDDARRRETRSVPRSRARRAFASASTRSGVQRARDVRYEFE